MNQPRIDKRKVVIGIIVILLVCAGLWFYFANRKTTYSFSIEAPENASIYIATENDGLFSQIGQTKASYQTQLESNIHIQIRDGDRTSIKTVNPRDADTQTIRIDSRPITNLEKYIEAPLKDFLINGDDFYGIVTTNNSLVSGGINEFKPSNPSFINVPYLEKVIWIDPKNFIFQAYGQEVGVFVNNSLYLGDNYFTNTETGLSNRSIYGITKYKNKPLVLLANDGLFVSSDFGKTITRVAGVGQTQLWYLDSDENQIYYASLDEPSSVATETEEPVDNNEEVFYSQEANIYVLNYDGSIKLNTKIKNINQIGGITHVTDSSEYVLVSDNQTHVINSSENVRIIPTYFGIMRDAVTTQNSILAFSTTGLWEIDLNEGVYYNRTPFDNDRYYVPGSSLLSNDGRFLIFSTQDSTGSGAVYRISL